MIEITTSVFNVLFKYRLVYTINLNVYLSDVPSAALMAYLARTQAHTHNQFSISAVGKPVSLIISAFSLYIYKCIPYICIVYMCLLALN